MINPYVQVKAKIVVKFSRNHYGWPKKAVGPTDGCRPHPSPTTESRGMLCLMNLHIMFWCVSRSYAKVTDG